MISVSANLITPASCCPQMHRSEAQSSYLWFTGLNGSDSQATSQAGSTDGNEDLQPSKPAPKPRQHQKVMTCMRQVCSETRPVTWQHITHNIAFIAVRDVDFEDCTRNGSEFWKAAASTSATPVWSTLLHAADQQIRNLQPSGKSDYFHLQGFPSASKMTSEMSDNFAKSVGEISANLPI